MAVSGERIEALLEEIRSLASPPAWKKVEELLRLLMEMYGAGLRRIGDVLGEAGPPGHDLASRLADDELVSSLLILHGLHPDPVEVRVTKALERVRPYLGSHGGDVELVAVDADEGVARLRLKGSCDGCPSSVLTVKLAVESAIQEAAPELERVEVEGVTDAAAKTTSVPGEPAGWVPLRAGVVGAGELRVREVEGSRIVVCRIEGQLYAYRDGCPACGAGLETAPLAGSVLACPRCAHRYDVRLAGRALDNGDSPLVPVPLLEDAAGARIALSEVRA